MAAGLAGALLAGKAQAQVLVTSITANFPDANGKVPAFNVVPGAAIPTWSTGFAQGVLTHGQAYEYCLSIASGNAKGKASVSFRISRGTTTIQSAVIIPASKYPVVANGIWYYCAGYKVLPTSPGPANLTGIVAYFPTGVTKPTVTHLTVPILLQ